MRKIMSFANRNFKEIIRDPLSLVFNFAFPLVMLIIFFSFTFGKEADFINNNVPMFASISIIPSVVVFGFSFLTLFSGMLVAKDNSTSFIVRLKCSPMKPIEIFLGYAIPNYVIALFQFILIYLLGYLLSLGTAVKFDLLNVGNLIALLIDIIAATFFISFGLLFGTIFNDKANSGISSILVNLTAIGSGMFMPIASMGGFKIVCQVLPFYHFVTLDKYATLMSFPNDMSYFDELIKKGEEIGMPGLYNIADLWWVNLIVILMYTCLAVGLSIFAFNKKIANIK